MEWKTLLYEAFPSFIGGGLALLGVVTTLLVQNHRNKKRQQEIIQGALHAIYEELNEIYNQLDSWSVEDPWKDFEKGLFPHYNSTCTFSKDYSIIFRSNANLIGQIESLNIRREIVKMYKALDVLMDAYKQNNKLMAQRLKADNMGQTELASALHIQLQVLAPSLREVHKFSKESINKLLDMLIKEFPQLSNQDSANNST